MLFEGIFATMQTTKVPPMMMRRLLSPPVRTDAAGRAQAAVLGLRRLEASLLAQTPLNEADVVCTTTESLSRLLGPWTKVVAISSSDFLGHGMSNTTTSSFWGGRLYTAHWIEALMAKVRRAKDRFGFRVVAGGAGAWQLAREEQAAARLGFDTIFEGYVEGQGPALFEAILQGQSPPALVHETGTCTMEIQPVRGPSVLGVIELSRGCGKGCRFCTIGRYRMEHLPPQTILADLQTNVTGGQPNIVNSSEDFLRYGCSGMKVNFEALRGLLEQMRQIKGLGFMQPDHANISSVLQFSDDELAELRRLMEWPSGAKHLWMNLGLESANGLLVAATGPGKIAPFRAEDWESMVAQAADKLVRCGFFPVFSVVLGLPGETPDDLRRTRLLVERLSELPLAVFPVFHEPHSAEGIHARQGFNVSKMTAEHLALYTTCYEINFRRIPAVYWDNQRAGGVSWIKRALLQALGQVEVRQWRRNFARVGRSIKAASGV